MIFVDPTYGGARRRFGIRPEDLGGGAVVRRCLDIGRAAGTGLVGPLRALCHFKAMKSRSARRWA